MSADRVAAELAGAAAIEATATSLGEEIYEALRAEGVIGFSTPYGLAEHAMRDLMQGVGRRLIDRWAS